jgi:hypothetical protein
MTAYQRPNTTAGSVQEGVTVRYTAKTHTSGVVLSLERELSRIPTIQQSSDDMQNRTRCKLLLQGVSNDHTRIQG